jgi:hypothetical protein
MASVRSAIRSPIAGGSSHQRTVDEARNVRSDPVGPVPRQRRTRLLRIEVALAILAVAVGSAGYLLDTSALAFVAILMGAVGVGILIARTFEDPPNTPLT